MRELIIFSACLCILVPLGVHMTATPAVAAGLEVYLPLDGDLLDASGNGNNGVLVNGSAGTHAYVTDGGHSGLDFGLTAGNTPENAAATYVDNDFVSIDYTLTNNGTISLWKKTTDVLYNYNMVWDNSGSSAVPQDNWECWFSASLHGKLYARAADGADGRWDDALNNAVYIKLNDVYGGDAPLWCNEWVNITVTWEKNTATTLEMNMYVNGVLLDTAPEMVWQDPGDYFYLAGGHAGNTAGIGIYDELSIWSEELSAEAVEDLYYYGVNGGCLISIAGDANIDGKVDEEDALIVAQNWLSTDVNWLTGDFNNDDIVDDKDVTLMAANWNGSGSLSVPEPSALVLIALGCFVLLGRRSSRK